MLRAFHDPQFLRAARFLKNIFSMAARNRNVAYLHLPWTPEPGRISEFWWHSRSMPEMKNFNDVFIFADSIINKNRTMLESLDMGPFSDYFTHAWKSAEQVYVIEQRVAKTHCRLIIVLGNVADDFGEIA
jgi:hypothetical protein